MDSSTILIHYNSNSEYTTVLPISPTTIFFSPNLYHYNDMKSPVYTLPAFRNLLMNKVFPMDDRRLVRIL